MTKSTKILLAVVVLVVAGGMAWYGVNKKTITPNPAQKTIKVGVITPLTGEAAAWGNWVKNSLNLAKQKTDASSIELIYEDSMCDPKTGVSAYNKLKNTNGVELVTGFVCSSVALAVAPLAEGDGITMITTGASATDLKDAGEHIFNMWPLN